MMQFTPQIRDFDSLGNDDDDEEKRSDPDEMVLQGSISGRFAKKKYVESESEEEVEALHVVRSRDKVVAPIVSNIEDTVLTREHKEKPATKDKHKGKHKGVSLTSEMAVELMIKERQAMEMEYASIRKENAILRENLEKQQHMPKQSHTVQDDGDINALKAEHARLVAENEALRKVRQEQAEIAKAAVRHPINRRLSDTTISSTPEMKSAREGPPTPFTPYMTASPASESSPAIPGPPAAVPKAAPKPTPNDLQAHFGSQHPALQRSQESPKKAPKYTGLPMLLWNGGILWKIPYNGKSLPETRMVMIKRAPAPGPKARPVRVLAQDDENVTSIPVAYIAFPPTLVWASAENPGDMKHARELVLHDGTYIVEGHQTPAFWKILTKGNPAPPAELCFSVVTGTRSLDLAAETRKEAIMWKNALFTLLVMLSPNKEWAKENLKRHAPTWRHDALDNAPAPKPAPVVEELPTNKDSLKEQMFQAAHQRNIRKLENILASGINVNLMETTTADTPMMVACRAGHADIVKLCLQYGARNDPHPDFGQTALHAAVYHKSYECAAVLLTAAAPSQSDVIITNLKDPKGQTPLHHAAQQGDIRMCNLLISHGGDISVTDAQGRNSLHICCAVGQKSCLAFLLDHCGDEYIEEVDNSGNTALHIAVENGQLQCARLLLETAANPQARNNQGQTPYNIASVRGHQQIALLLLEYHDATPKASPMKSRLSMPTKHRAASDSHLIPHVDTDLSAFSVDMNELQRSTASVRMSKTMNAFMSPTHDGITLPRPHTATKKGSPSPNHLYFSSPQQTTHKSYRVVSAANTSMEFDPRRSLGAPASERISHDRYSDVDYGAIPHTSRDGLRPVFNGLYVNQSYQSDYSQYGMQTYQASPSAQRTDYGSYSYEDTSPQAEMPYGALEVFEYNDTTWTVYTTDEGHVYYLDDVSQHSQWDDPRLHGIIHYGETEQQAPSTPVRNDSEFRRPKVLSDGEITASGRIKRYGPKKIALSPKNAYSSSDDDDLLGRIKDLDEQEGARDQRTLFSTRRVCSSSDSPMAQRIAKQKQSPVGKAATRREVSELDDSQVLDELEEVPQLAQRLVPATSRPRNESANPFGYVGDPEFDEEDPEEESYPVDGIPAGDAPTQVPQRAAAAPKTKSLAKMSRHKESSDDDMKRIISERKKQSHTQSDRAQSPSTESPAEFDAPETNTYSDWDDDATPPAPEVPPPEQPQKPSSTKPFKPKEAKEPAEPKTLQSIKPPGLQVKLVSGPPPNTDPQTLLRNKLFQEEEGGYGNGGNTLILPTPSDVSPEKKVHRKSPKNKTVLSGKSPKKSSPEGTEEERLQKYTKMLEMGVPVRTVRRKMETDGESKDMIMRMIRLADDVVVSQGVQSMLSTKNTKKEESSAPKISVADLKADPVVGKYAKMSTMGIPPGSIAQKMQLDNVPAEDRDKLLRALGLLVDTDVDVDRSSATDSNRLSQRRTSVPLQKLHWNTLPPEKLENTIWAAAAEEGEDSLREDDVAELEKLFGTQTNTSNVSVAKSRDDDKLKLHLLDGKRAQNIVITLAQFRAAESHEALLEAACSMDPLDGLLSADKLENLGAILPTPSEIKKAHQAAKSQHPAEVFFTLSVLYYPELPRRITCGIYCEHFDEVHDAVVNKMQTLIDACNQVISSDKLARILQKMLAVGNIMNEGTMNGKASGITLDSLLKMVHTKGVDKRTSVLDYVIKTLLEKGESRVLCVSDDLELVDDAARISGRDTHREVDQLERGYQSAKNEYSKPVESERVQQYTHVFQQRLGAFLSRAEEKIEEVMKLKGLVARKVTTVIEYFGEDENTCDTTKIFQTLQQFKSAVEVSKQTAERKARMRNAKRNEA